MLCSEEKEKVRLLPPDLTMIQSMSTLHQLERTKLLPLPLHPKLMIIQLLELELVNLRLEPILAQQMRQPEQTQEQVLEQVVRLRLNHLKLERVEKLILEIILEHHLQQVHQLMKMS